MPVDPELIIPENAIGQTLRSVSALIFDLPDEDGPASRESICLHFSSCVITLRALTDTSELSVDDSCLSIPNDPEFDGYYDIADISNEKFFPQLIGKTLRNWWSLTNDAGYQDGFMVSFTAHESLCFVAMNNHISILSTSGEQCS